MAKNSYFAFFFTLVSFINVNGQGVHCIPDPICKYNLNQAIPDGGSSIGTLINPYIDYLAELDIPNGQSVNTIYTTDMEFRINGTHTEANDLTFYVYTYDLVREAGYGGFTYATSLTSDKSDFDFTLTNDAGDNFMSAASDINCDGCRYRASAIDAWNALGSAYTLDKQYFVIQVGDSEVNSATGNVESVCLTKLCYAYNGTSVPTTSANTGTNSPSSNPTAQPTATEYNTEILNDPMNNFNNWPARVATSGSSIWLPTNSDYCNSDPPCIGLTQSNNLFQGSEPYIETEQNTLGLTNICIEYEAHTQSLNGADKTGIYYSCDGGSTFNTRVEWTTNTRHFSYEETSPELFYITDSNCFRSNFRVRIAGDYQSGNAYFYINDFKLLGNCGDTPSPIISPTDNPTDTPSYNPTDRPTQSPTDTPTSSPTDAPTNGPTNSPTNGPSDSPTQIPTDGPTSSPSNLPSFSPTEGPSESPSNLPSFAPTDGPSESPNNAPTNVPTSGPSYGPSNNPTENPLQMPSKSPTVYPSVNPTMVPSKFPSPLPTSQEPTMSPVTTANPTDAYTTSQPPTVTITTPAPTNTITTSLPPTTTITASCNYTTGDLTVDWDTEFMSTSSSVQSSISSYQNINDDGNLEIIVTVNADYVVDGIYQDDTNIGVTYVIDTQEFTGERLLGTPNTCENRYEEDFVNLTFSDYWTYTLDPESGTFPGYMGMGMEYPISDWNLVSNVNDDSCSVTWTRTFSFEELYYSCGFDLTETDDEISLSGVFYLALVSPSGLFYPSNSLTDTGEYFVKQLEAHSVSISFDKSYTLKTLSQSVNLFGAQIVGAHYDPLSNIFTLQIYTYVPNYLHINYVTNFVPSSNGTYGNSSIYEDDYDGECLLRDDYRCWQRFILTVPDDECERDSFNDIFNILGWLLCYDDNDYNDTDSYCYTFLTNRNEFENFYSYIGSVELNYALSCNEAVYQQDFSNNGLLAFATDSNYNEQNTDPVYSSGDTAYMGLSISDTLNSYSLVTIEIISGSLCTSDDSSISSCSDDSVNIYDLYDIMLDSTINYQLLNVYTDEFKIEFSIVIPVISQDYICVEILVELTLIDNGDDRRRVLLSSSGEFSSFSNYGASAKVLNPDNIQIEPNSNNNKSNNTYIYVATSTAILFIISIAVIAFIMVRKYGNNNLKYEEVVEMQIKNVKDEFEGLVE